MSPKRARVQGARLVLSVAAAVSASACLGTRPERPARLIVVVMIDAQRADHLGCYGSPRGLTPSIDRLAARSFVFEQAIATSAWTRSSVATLFTGRYPRSHGALGRADGLGPDALTVAEVLSGRGWETLGITTNGNAGLLFGFAQGFDSFVYPGDGLPIAAEAVTELALQSVVQRRERLARKPLFLFLHYVDPHDPYLPHPDLVREPEPPGRFSGARPDLVRLDQTPPAELSADDLARIRYLYAGEVRYCDLWLGRLFDGLERMGVFDDTLVLLTADHGEGLWDHAQRSHGSSLYEEQIHVPLIVHYPGQLARHARRIAEPVSTVDVAPTLLAAAGIGTPEPFQGRDLAPLTRGEKRSEGSEGIYSELALDHAYHQALRLDGMKLIHSKAGPSGPRSIELFDLRSDPRELRNLAEQQPATTARLLRALKSWRATTRAAGREVPRVPPEELPESVREQLRALGYVQ